MSKKPIISLQEEPYFTWRGKEVSRTENLSDIVFAMALTLVVASSVPDSFNELMGLWREVIAIGFCFIMLLLIWHIHYIFFRRYDLEGVITIFLNSVLIFLVMIFAYPLKFLASFLVNFFTGGFSDSYEISSVLTLDQAPWLTAIYSGGYAAVFAVFTLLYWHALNRADEIGLSRAERVLTRSAIKANIVHVIFGFLVTLLAIFLPGNWGLMAGGFYALLGIPLSYIGRKALQEAKLASEAETI